MIYQIKTERINKASIAINQVNEQVEAFARVCYTEGNYILLPERAMNNQRYNVTQDRMDMTLYECFDKGIFAKFYKNEADLVRWIDGQNLRLFFAEDNICRDNINWLVTERKPKLISEMNSDEIYQYLDNSIKIINKRNKK